jgi:hypothetical protein
LRAAFGGNFVTEVPVPEPDKSGQSPQESQPQSESPSQPLGPAGWITIVVLGGFLAAGIFYAVHTWNALAGTPIPTSGWVFLGLGVFFTILVGGGLMGLLFYSSRKGRDF